MFAYNKLMTYSIRKISKKVGRFEKFQDVICVCASDGENVSVIAEIHDNICEEHGTPESWAEKIVGALNMQKFVDSVTN